MKDNKYEFFKSFASIDELELSVQTLLNNKFYNLWMDKFQWSGLDEDIKEQQENYIMRKFWSDGTVAIRNIKNTDMIVITPYNVGKYNLYDFPEEITLVNLRNAPKTIIPSKIQVVNKDACIIWCQPNHKPIKHMVDYYVERITKVEMILNTNLDLQKMPFLIACDEGDKKAMEDIVDKILNDEPVIYANIQDLAKVQTLVTNSPYIVDKLKSYEQCLENELLTVLGIDNNGATEKKAQMLLDEVNANNDVINISASSIETEIRKGLERVNQVLGRNITIESKSKPVDSLIKADDERVVSEPEEAIYDEE